MERGRSLHGLNTVLISTLSPAFVENFPQLQEENPAINLKKLLFYQRKIDYNRLIHCKQKGKVRWTWS